MLIVVDHGNRMVLVHTLSRLCRFVEEVRGQSSLEESTDDSNNCFDDILYYIIARSNEICPNSIESFRRC